MTLGLDVDDVDDTIRRINYYFTTLEEFNKANVAANLSAIKDLLEKYHKFRVQLYNGKPKTLLPVSFKQALNEPVISSPVNLQNISPINHSMPILNVPKPPQSISPVPDANKFNPKRKRVPCVHYHSPMGCARGERCDFIHDPNFKGQPTPNMDKYVRPFNMLSKNPDTNYKNVQKLSRQYTGPNPSTYNGVSQPQHYSQPMAPPSYQPNMQSFGNNMGAGGFPMAPPPPRYGNQAYSNINQFVPPPPGMPSYLHSNIDRNTDFQLGKRQDYRDQGYRDNDR